MDTLAENTQLDLKITHFLPRIFQMSFPTPRVKIRGLLRGGFQDDGCIGRDVQENQIGGDEVDDHSQEHHRGPSEAAVLAQQTEEAAA